MSAALTEPSCRTSLLKATINCVGLVFKTAPSVGSLATTNGPDPGVALIVTVPVWTVTVSVGVPLMLGGAVGVDVIVKTGIGVTLGVSVTVGVTVMVADWLGVGVKVITGVSVIVEVCVIVAVSVIVAVCVKVAVLVKV